MDMLPVGIVLRTDRVSEVPGPQWRAVNGARQSPNVRVPSKLQAIIDWLDKAGAPNYGGSASLFAPHRRARNA